MRRELRSVVIAGLAGLLLPASTVMAAATWFTVDDLVLGRTAFAAATLSDGTVLVAGGSPGSVVGATAERYDPGADFWSQTGSLSIGRSGHTLSALSDGRALAAGGNSATGLQRSAEAFNPSSGSWTTVAPMSTARANHSATVLTNGRVLIVGGVANKGGATNEVEIYDAATNSWSRADSLHNPRYNHSATLLADGRVLVAGGFTPGKFHTPMKTAEVYDVASDRWSVVGTMEVERAVHAAALLPDGRVLVAGGFTQPPNVLTVTATAELFDPATERWTPTGSMTVARRAIEGALLSDGTVLVAGGFDSANSLLATAEVFNPAAGTWSPTANMSLARAPVLARLNDGRVLAIASIGRVTTTYVEAYQP